MVGGWLAVNALLFAAPLADCPQQQQVLKALVRRVIVSCQLPAGTDADFAPFAEEDLTTWVRDGVRWRRPSAHRFGRGCSPAFLLETNACEWVLVEDFALGAVHELRAYASSGSSDALDARVAKMFAVPLASPSDARDALATAIANQRFVVVAGRAPVQRASLATYSCVSDEPSSLCAVMVKPREGHGSPIAPIDVGGTWSAARITFGKPVQTGFWSCRGPVEEPLRVDGRCVRASNLTLSLDSGLWKADWLSGCEWLEAADGG